MKDPATDSRIEFTDTKETSSGGFLGRRWRAARRWLLVTGNRWTVTAAMSAVIFASTVVVGAFGPVSTNEFLDAGISPSSAFVELLKTIVALVTIVLSINQLVLSSLLGTVDEQRSRIEDTLSLRDDVEDVLDAPSSARSPKRFLQSLVGALRTQTDALAELDVEGRLASDRDRLVRELESSASDELAALAGTDYGRIDAITALLAFDVSDKIQRLRRLRAEQGDDLSEADGERLSTLISTLELFTSAREYLKMTYIKSAYIEFSIALLYVGFPSLVFTFLASLLYGPNVLPGAFLGVEYRLWFVALAAAVALTPFSLMVSYVSRLATLSESTLFIGPFTVD